ncbi:MAG: hypothetical protein AAB633_00930, partial [Patescibacteria group bacterium]
MLKRLSAFVRHPLIVFVAVAVWLCLEYVVLGPYSYLRIGDNFDVFIPRLVALWNGFGAWGVAYWSPLFAGGIDRLATDVSFFNIG